MNKIQFKPCPFCGEKAKGHICFDQYRVYCTNKYCHVSMIHDDIEDALFAWNRRTPENPSEINENATDFEKKSIDV